MTQIASWAFLGLAVGTMILNYAPSVLPIEFRVGASRDLSLIGILCAVIAGVLRMP